MEIVAVELDGGERGYGDNLYLSYGRTDDGTVQRVEGANAVSLLYDDSLF